MLDSALNVPVLVLMIGSILLLTLILKHILEKIGIPPFTGYILLGVLLRLLDARFAFLSEGVTSVLDFFEKTGLVTLLFLIGLESDLSGLIKQLKNASFIWVFDILVSALVGFSTAFFLLKLETVPSLFIATAFMATSVGISIATWKKRGILDTPEGELLVDVAEMDDISSIFFMTLLFTLLGSLQGESARDVTLLVITKTGMILLKFVLFSLACILFSKFFEKQLSKLVRKIEIPPEPILTVTAIGFIIAAVSELIGFSLAIGAFFAGLIFSRDSEIIKMENSFKPLYEFFSPFFFIGVGMMVDPASLIPALGLGIILAVSAILAKTLGVGLAALAGHTKWKSLLLGVSMIPRAEVSMIIIHHGLTGNYISPQLFGAMLTVCLITALVTPFSVSLLAGKVFPGLHTNKKKNHTGGK